MKKFFWIDLEMTGLDEKTDTILEVAVIVTDLAFKEVERYSRVVFQPAAVLENMNDWCKKHHGESGLTAEVPQGTPLAQVEKDLISLVARHFPSEEKIVLVGNSIHNDRRFIDRHLPEFSKRLHYRLIDVSSFKEIYRERYGLKFEKANAHRAVGDILESIKELETYLSHVKLPVKS